MRHGARPAIVVRCGAWTVWQNGLRRGKINTRRKFGYSRNARVRCAGHHFVYSMCAMWKDKTSGEIDEFSVM